jgi:hypothetical protein
LCTAGRAGLQSVVGVALGNGINAIGAPLRLTLLFSVWPAAFAAGFAQFVIGVPSAWHWYIAE